MHSATVNWTRYAESALVAGTAAKKGTASNGVTAITGTSDKPAGIATDAKSAADAAGTGDPSVALTVLGPAVGLAGGTVVPGDSLQVAADGRLVAKSAAGWVVGEAKTGGAIGELIEVLVNIRKEPA